MKEAMEKMKSQNPDMPMPPVKSFEEKEILSGFKFNDGEWISGKIFDIKERKLTDAKIRIKEKGKLQIITKDGSKEKIFTWFRKQD